MNGKCIRSCRWRLYGALAASLLAAGGCGAETAQRELIRQAQLGVGQIRAAQQSRGLVLASLFDARRRRLDDAFDHDISARPLLDVAWVIDHRKAYVVALEAMLKQQAASTQADQTTGRDLDAVNLVLKKLSWMSQVRENWLNMLTGNEVSNEQN